MYSMLSEVVDVIEHIPIRYLYVKSFHKYGRTIFG